MSVPLAIASTTFTGLVRSKVFLFIFIFALIVLGSAAFLLDFTAAEQLKGLADVALGAMSVFSSLLAIAATAQMLPRDIEDRTLYTILAKPVTRFQYLSGKLLGVILLLAAAVFAMGLLSCLLLYFREQAALRQVAAMIASAPKSELSPDDTLVLRLSFSPSFLYAIILIHLKSCVIAAICLLVSTFTASHLFTIMATTAIYFIAHLQSVAREYWLTAGSLSLPNKLFLAFVALVFPDLNLFNLSDDIVAGNIVPPALFLQIAGWGLFYIVFYLILSGLLFAKREL